MLKTHKVTKTVEETVVDEVICNRCAKPCIPYELEEGYKPHASDYSYLAVRKTWGWPSPRDMTKWEFDICESCFDEFIATFKIPPTRPDLESECPNDGAVCDRGCTQYCARVEEKWIAENGDPSVSSNEAVSDD
jgi:hypothetical protein